jgi:hypothetical protein
MTITWGDLSSLSEMDTPLFIGEPPFTADGIVSATIPPDPMGLQTVRDQFLAVGWNITGDNLLTTLVQAGDRTYPVLIGTARTHRLQRIWVATAGLVHSNAQDTKIDFDSVGRASWLLMQRHLPKEILSSNMLSPNPLIANSCRSNVPIPLHASEDRQPHFSSHQIPVVQVGLRLILDKSNDSSFSAPWCAYAITNALHDLQTLYNSDSKRFRETFGEIRPLNPDDAGLSPWPEELVDFADPPSIDRDLSILAFEGGERFRDGTQQGAFDGERLLREAAAGSGERAGAAINTLIFSCLDTKRQRVGALSFLLKGVLQEQSFESWNSVSNLSALLLNSDQSWAGVPLAQIIFELDDLRLDSEASYLLGQAARHMGLPNVARHYLNIGISRNPGNYEDQIRKALQQLPSESIDTTTDEFETLINARLPQLGSDSALQVAQLIHLMNIETTDLASAGIPDHPYLALAERVKRSGNTPANAALLALCTVEASEAEAAYAFAQLVQVPRWKSAESRILRAATHLTARFPLSQGMWIEIAIVAASLDLPMSASGALSAALSGETPKSHIPLSSAIAAVQIAASVSPNEANREALLAVLRHSQYKEAKSAFLEVTHDEEFLEEALRSADIEQAEAAARNPYVNASSRPGFWDGISNDLAWIAASSESAPATTLRDLTSHGAESVRRAVARNPRTPTECLDQLASDQAWAVREAVLTNPGASDEARAAATLLQS